MFLNCSKHRNGAYGIVMRGVQKCTCAGASLRSKNYAPLCCIKLDTATEYVGAIAGQNNNVISVCFSTALVESASGIMGGLCADNNDNLYRSYYLDRGYTNAADSNSAFSADDFKNGKVTYEMCLNTGNRL